MHDLIEGLIEGLIEDFIKDLHVCLMLYILCECENVKARFHMQEIDYLTGPIPTKANMDFKEWRELLDKSLADYGCCASMDYEARKFFECSYTPKSAARELSRGSHKEVKNCN